MFRSFPAVFLACGLLFAAAARPARADEPAEPDTLSAQESLEDLRQEMNAALADLSARLNEARNRQSQATVDGVIYGTWMDDMAKAHGRNAFELDRVYVNVRGTLNRTALYRVTLDASRVTGERLVDFVKYAYGGIVLGPQLTVTMGMQQTPLIDFQEGIWKYRFAQKVLTDNEGKLSSSDLGIGAEGILTPDLTYKLLVSNGETYSRPDPGKDKAFAGRLTYRLPVDGLRLSAFAQYQLADTVPFANASAVSQLHDVYELFLSYEQPAFTVFGELAGTEDDAYKTYPTAVRPAPVVSRVQGGGACLGGFWEFVTDWRVFGKLDLFDPDRMKPDNSHLRSIAGLSYNWGTNLVLALSDQWTNYGYQAGKANTNSLVFQAQITY